MYNTQTKPCIVKYMDSMQRKSTLRQVLSNNFTLHNIKQAAGESPFYDVYALCHRGCDNVNSQIAGKLWPHKYGDRGVLWARGTQHNFALMMTCVNTFNAYKAVRRGGDNSNFTTDCLTTADEAFAYACCLVDDV